MTRALPLLLLALSLPAAATDSESFARRYLAYVHAVGQHSERLWPGWRMADKAFLYSDGRSTWVADAEGRAQRTTAAGDSDPDLDLSYAFPRYRGRPAVLLQISAAHLRSNTGNSETLAAIGPHEAFHRYAQEDWPGLRKPGGYRGDLATLDPRPREYRYALFQSLLQALRTPGQRDSYLSDAQGWLRRWREAAPEESRLAAQVDLSEGTARYIEMAAAARYRTDFAEDPQRYRQALREYALAFYDANEIGVGVDSEAYEIGALAGVLLDLRDDDADWKEAATAGTWPLDYLLRDQPPAWSKLPDDARARGERYRREMSATRQRLVELQEAFADPRRPLLVIPQPRRTIGFATAASEVRGGFYVLADGPFRQAYLGARWNVGELTLDGVDYLEGDAEAYCPGYGRSALIPLRGGDWREGTLAPEEPGLRGRLATARSLVDGRTLYCAAENAP
ncbi:TPA: hypothetical protein NIA55_003758 [Pseudomonas aeruginosa]|nr:hypothetical protein [Pseudomonas aeruginosa]